MAEVTETEFTLLQAEVRGVKSDVESLKKTIEDWIKSRNIGVWRVLGLIATIIVPASAILMLYVAYVVSPWATVANQAKASADTLTTQVVALNTAMGKVQAENATSIQDRLDKGKQLENLITLETKLATDLARETAIRASKLTEVETQFRALERYENLQRKYTNTMIALLWQRAYGETFPIFQYYPSISQPDGKDNTE